MEVTMTASLDHPAWCDPDRCGASVEQPHGMHCSRSVVLGPYPPGTVVAEVSVAQGPPVDGYPWSGRPYVALALRDAECELCLAPLSVEMAGALGRVLVGFVREVVP
jgi:hypothetical protein